MKMLHKAKICLDKYVARAYLYTLRYGVIYSAGWSSLVARRAHNPEVVGSNPAPATKTPAQGLALSIFVGGTDNVPTLYRQRK